MPISIDLINDDVDVEEDAGVGMTSVDSSDVDIDLQDVDVMKTPDDLNTPEALNDSVFDGELEWDESKKLLGISIYKRVLLLWLRFGNDFADGAIK